HSIDGHFENSVTVVPTGYRASPITTSLVCPILDRYGRSPVSHGHAVMGGARYPVGTAVTIVTASLRRSSASPHPKEYVGACRATSRIARARIRTRLAHPAQLARAAPSWGCKGIGGRWRSGQPDRPEESAPLSAHRESIRPPWTSCPLPFSRARRTALEIRDCA